VYQDTIILLGFRENGVTTELQAGYGMRAGAGFSTTRDADERPRAEAVDGNRRTGIIHSNLIRRLILLYEEIDRD
jgi:hypothetical protein